MERGPYLAAAFAALAAFAMPEFTFPTAPPRRLPADLAHRARDAAVRRGLDAAFFESVVWAEGGRAAALSSGGARGPAQVTRSAAEDDCPDLPWSAIRREDAANLDCGARILRARARRWLGARADPILAAALYNTKKRHWPRIARERRVPPFRETTAYVTRISRYYCQLGGRRLLDPKRHLDASLLAFAERVDREMEAEIRLERQQPRPGCSPFGRSPFGGGNVR